MSNMRNVNQYRIVSMNIMEAGEHHDQYTRPYSINLSASTLDTLRTRVHDEGGVLSASAIGSVFGTSEGLYVSAVPDTDIDGEAVVAPVPYGWEERRFRFALMFEASTPSGVEVELVQGMTSHWEDPSIQSSYLPNDTEFVINSIIKLRQARIKTARGHENGWRVGKSDHLLSSSSGGIGRGRNGLLEDTRFTLRPTEIISMAATAPYREELESSNGVNTVGVMNNLPTLTSRTNNTAMSYASRFFSAVGRSFSSEAIGGHQEIDNGGFGMDSRVANARSYLHESGYSEYQFCRALSKIHTVKTNTFQLSDLFKLDPNAPRDLGKAYQVDPNYAGEARFRDYTSEWYGTDISTQVAAIVGSSVPVFMSRYGIMQCSFNITNQTHDGAHDFAFTSVRSLMDDSSITDTLITNFKETLIDECIRQISDNNNRDYDLECSFSLIGDSTVTVSMDGGKPYTYAVPTFTDGLLSPQVTTNQEYRYEFADHLLAASTLLVDPDVSSEDFTTNLMSFGDRSTLHRERNAGRDRQSRGGFSDGFRGFSSGAERSTDYPGILDSSGQPFSRGRSGGFGS